MRLRRRRPLVRTASDRTCGRHEKDEEGSGCSEEQVPPPSARQDPAFATAGEECQECGEKSTSSHQPLDSELLSEVPVELFTSREEAEAIVQAWDRNEPDQAGTLRIEQIEFETSAN
jgi:hypothetical protein